VPGCWSTVSRMCPEPDARARPTSALRQATRPREDGQPITSMPSTIPGGPQPLRSLGTIRPRRTFSIRLTGPVLTIVFDPSTGMFLSDVSISEQQFGGFVQHTRPSILECLPDRLPTIEEDLNLGAIDPSMGLSESGFRRAVSERAGPPYIGRGLMEAIPNQDLVDQVDPDDAVGAASSLNSSTFERATYPGDRPGTAQATASRAVPTSSPSAAASLA
jgi:hypothetical protein